MADITAFPDIDIVMVNNGPTFTFTAAGAITKGQVVAFEATGASLDVTAVDATAGEYPIGVAITSAADNGSVTVALVGSICYVANADDTTGIDAGDFVESNDCAVKGTVSAAAVTASGATVTNHWVVGQALDDIAGGGSGRIIVMPMEVTQGNAS